jgi:hypothetical protein
MPPPWLPVVLPESVELRIRSTPLDPNQLTPPPDSVESLFATVVKAIVVRASKPPR